MIRPASLPVRAPDWTGHRTPEPPWATWVLVVSTVVIFLLQLMLHLLFREDVLGDAMAFSPDALADGRYWTLLTYAWAHAVTMYGHPWLFWLHIVSNLIPLVCLGPALEDMLGHLRFLGLYLGGAIAAALVWYLSDSGLDPSDGIIGASGAVFAVIAGIGTAAPRQRVILFIFFFLPVGATLRWVALIIVGIEVVQVIFNLMPEMAHWAHLGGAIFGCIYTWLVLRSRPPEHLGI